jgi:fructoselysine-6-P-deglycase FrlB-like protein
LSKKRQFQGCRFFVPHKASLDEFATPLHYILSMHIFGYEMALQRGYDPTARRYNLVPQHVRHQEEE